MNLIIVDGYNVINSSGRLSGLPLEHARDVLFDLLRDYAGFTNVSVMLVFDAHYQNTPESVTGSLDDGMVVYTGAGETADMLIERTVRVFSRRGVRIRVATSDGLEQVMVMNYAERMSARELLRDIEAAKEEYRRSYLEAPDTLHSRNMLESRLDDSYRQALEQLRRGMD